MVLSLITFCTASGMEKKRQRLDFNEGWSFHLGEVDPVVANAVDFGATAWRKLTLPHDWAIEGEFSEKNPAGAGGGALPGGIGWYRKVFSLLTEDDGHKIFIDFDGVYMNSEVGIHGLSLVIRP